MAKFILKATIFLLGLLVLVQSLACISRSLAPDNNAITLHSDKQAVETLLASAQQLQAVAIGNSHAQAIDFDTLAYNGYTLARSGRDFFEIKYYLDALQPKLPKVKTVFITVSYFSFQRDNAVSDESRVRRIHTYAVIPAWYPLKGDFANFVIGKTHPIFPVMDIAREDNWQGVFKTGVAPDTSPNEIDLMKVGCVDQGYQYINAHAQLRAIQHIRQSADMAGNHPNLQADTYQTIVEVIQQLQKQNVRIVFFTPPYFYTYTQTYQANAPVAITSMEQNMQKLRQAYGVEYYDFSTDSEFVNQHQLFTDSDHLNRCGARLFSVKLKQAMAGAELLSGHQQ